MAGNVITKASIQAQRSYGVNLDVYFWSPECVDTYAALDDNVVALLEIEVALGNFHRKSTKADTWALSNYLYTFERDGRLRARKSRAGAPLLDMNQQTLYTLGGSGGKIWLDGNAKDVTHGKHSTMSIIDAEGFEEWWAHITGPTRKLPPYAKRSPNPVERLRHPKPVEQPPVTSSKRKQKENETEEPVVKKLQKLNSLGPGRRFNPHESSPVRASSPQMGAAGPSNTSITSPDPGQADVVDDLQTVVDTQH